MLPKWLRSNQSVHCCLQTIVRWYSSSRVIHEIPHSWNSCIITIIWTVVIFGVELAFGDVVHSSGLSHASWPYSLAILLSGVLWESYWIALHYDWCCVSTVCAKQRCILNYAVFQPVSEHQYAWKAGMMILTMACLPLNRCRISMRCWRGYQSVRDKS